MIFFSISFLGIVSVLFSTGSADCVVSNNQTDELVAISNRQTLDDPSIPVRDQAVVLPLFLGLHVKVKTSEGTLGNRSTLNRRLDAIRCEGDNNVTLSSFFVYDNLTLDLGKVEAKFSFLVKTVAKIRIRIDGNSFRISVSKTADNICSLNWLDVQELQDYDVQVESTDRWKRWFTSPLLSYGITHYNKEFLMNIITEQIKALFKPFIDTFCNTGNK